MRMYLMQIVLPIKSKWWKLKTKRKLTKKIIIANEKGKSVVIGEWVDKEHEDGKRREEERIKKEEIKKPDKVWNVNNENRENKKDV